VFGAEQNNRQGDIGSPYRRRRNLG